MIFIGMYYLRSKPATNAIKFTVDVEALVNEASGTNDVDMNLFNTKITTVTTSVPVDSEAVETEALLTKRDPNAESEAEKPKTCTLLVKKRRMKGDPPPTQQEIDECQMCGS